MSVPAAFMGIILVWATTPLAIKWSSEGVGFLFGLTARMVLGMVLCLILITLLRVPFRWTRQALYTYFASGVGLYGAMMCAYWGAQYISSGLVAVVYGLLPMLTFFASSLLLREPLWQPAKLSGALVGFAGLLVIFSPQDGFKLVTALGISGILASATLHALSMVLVKRIGADVPALAVTGGGLLVAVPLYLLTWALTGTGLPPVVPGKALFSIVYLGVMGSVLGFVLFYYALKHVSAAALALLTLVTPVLALALGHWLNGEPLQAGILVGAGLILAGLGLHNWGDKIFPAEEGDRP
jgi:drug/metabolite transporter (DMT)-like permease